jgi:hypothetical protein
MTVTAAEIKEVMARCHTDPEHRELCAQISAITSKYTATAHMLLDNLARRLPDADRIALLALIKRRDARMIAIRRAMLREAQ